MKKSILLIAPIIGMCIGLSSCEKKDYLSFEYEQYTKEIIKDNYRNMYQIFPISFSCLSVWARTLYKMNTSSDSNHLYLDSSLKGKAFILAQV